MLSNFRLDFADISLLLQFSLGDIHYLLNGFVSSVAALDEVN